MKLSDEQSRVTVIVEHEMVEPGFYIAPKLGSAVLPSIAGPFATRDEAIAERARLG